MTTPSPTASPSGAYEALHVKPVVNACGIYTDLGGSTLDPELWTALGEVNARWASLPELLDRSGELIAALVGAPAARVVPGASAGIALATAACIARGDSPLIGALPERDGAPAGIAQQVVHSYKYTRCARLSGGTIVDVGDVTGTSEADLETALADRDVVAILHPAHLDEAPGGIPLTGVVPIARAHGVPVIVDAAYQVFPTELLSTYHERGADLVITSAKYFFGPNAGGFVAGRDDLIAQIGALDFTGFEGDPRRPFGRAFKMDRTAVVATVLALERWLSRDHSLRWATYARDARTLIDLLTAAGVAGARPVAFTLDERVVSDPVNSVLLPMSRGADLAAALAEGTPAIRCVDVEAGALFCLETVSSDELEVIATAVAAAWRSHAAEDRDG